MRCSIEPRTRSLRTANYNVALVPAAETPIDLSCQPCRDGPDDTDISVELAYQKLARAVDSVLDCTFCLPVHLGRGAEMAIASMINPGGSVVGNEVYLTGQWSIQQHGGDFYSLLDTKDTKFSGNLDLDLLANRLSIQNPAYVQVTAPLSLLSNRGGAPVSLGNLHAVRSLIHRLNPGTPLVLDASRIFENAAQIRLKEPGQNDRPLVEIVREMAATADIVFLSGRKDLGASTGGIIAFRDEIFLSQLVEFVEIFEGSAKTGGLLPAEINQMASGLVSVVEDHTAMVSVQRLEGLAHHLIGEGVPVVSWGAGALYLDARKWLPGVPVAEHPAQTLVNALYLYAGIRAIGTPATSQPEEQIIRLCVSEEVLEYLRRALPRLALLLYPLKSGFRRQIAGSGGVFLDSLEPVCGQEWCLQPHFQEPDFQITCRSGFSNSTWPQLESVLRKVLELKPANRLVPAQRERGAQRLLTEIARLHQPPFIIESSNQVMQRLASYFQEKNLLSFSSASRKIYVVNQVELGAALKIKHKGDVIALDVGPMESWTAGQWPGHFFQEDKQIDIIWSCDLVADNTGGGFVAFKADTSLYRVLRETMLFSVGSLHDGGLAGTAMLRLARLLDDSTERLY